MKFYSTLKSANQSGINGTVTLLIVQFQRRVKFYSDIYNWIKFRFKSGQQRLNGGEQNHLVLGSGRLVLQIDFE